MGTVESHLSVLLDDYCKGYIPLPTDSFSFERDARELQSRLLAKNAPDDFDDFDRALNEGIVLQDDATGETRIVRVNNFPEFTQYYIRIRLRQCFEKFVEESTRRIGDNREHNRAASDHVSDDFPPAAADAFGGPAALPPDLSDDYSDSGPRLNFLKPKSERSRPDPNRVSGKTVVKAGAAIVAAIALALGIMVATMPAPETQPPTPVKKKANDPSMKKDAPSGRSVKP